MACRDEEVVERLQKQCVAGNWSLDRLHSAPAHIFVDLFTLLAHWSDVWRRVRRELALRDTQLHGVVASSSVLDQTRTLHRDIADVIAFREDLRLHIIAFQKFQSLIRSPWNGKATALFGNDSEMSEIEERVEECLQSLNHQQESSAVLNKQLENLLSLVGSLLTRC